MTNETVTIPKSEYDQLRRDALHLWALEASGVDNWDWYGDAFRDYQKQAVAEGLLDPSELDDEDGVVDEESDEIIEPTPEPAAPLRNLIITIPATKSKPAAYLKDMCFGEPVWSSIKEEAYRFSEEMQPQKFIDRPPALKGAVVETVEVENK